MSHGFLKKWYWIFKFNVIWHRGKLKWLFWKNIQKWRKIYSYAYNATFWNFGARNIFNRMSKKKVFFATYLARMGAWLFPSRFLNFRIFRNFRQSSVILPMVAKLIVILICDFQYTVCPNRSLIFIIESAVLFYIFLQSLSKIGGVDLFRPNRFFLP